MRMAIQTAEETAENMNDPFSKVTNFSNPKLWAVFCQGRAEMQVWFFLESEICHAEPPLFGG
jgi:hypothetical protein